MKFNLHYAPLQTSDKDISLISFNTHEKMVDFIDEMCINRNGECVWLIAKDKSTDVFISESHISIQDFLQTKNAWNTVNDYFLQEYESFQDAYEVALTMVETSKLCYAP